MTARRNVLLMAIALAVSLSMLTPAWAQDRSALVIANHDYGDQQLPQVKADAALVSAAFRQEGFRVTLVENVPHRELKEQIERFARGTTTRGVAVCYFAGLAGRYATYNSKGVVWNHVQGAGRPKDPKAVDRDSLPLAEIIKLFADHSAATSNLIVVDAPGLNPFHTDRAKHPAGLAAIDTDELPADVAVVLSFAPQAAVDRPSQLAAAFAKHLPRGRESLGNLLSSVADATKQASDQQQAPHVACRTPLARTAWRAGDTERVLLAETPREGDRAGQTWINSLGMVFCWCPPGKFAMGNTEPGRSEFEDAEPVEVSLPQGFWMSKFELTQLEASRLKEGGNRYVFPGKNLPHHMVQVDHTNKLITALNASERKAGRLPDDWTYALPTEAEWEYACRAGTSARYSFGNDPNQLHRHANYADKSLLADEGANAFADPDNDDGVGRALALVGSYEPNAWGLFDMHGNVAEWCADRYLPHLIGGVAPRVDEKEKAAQPAHVYRGGSWCSTAKSCEAGFRNSEYSGGNAKSREFLGVRLVLKKK